jgi:hypothetical protein
VISSATGRTSSGAAGGCPRRWGGPWRQDGASVPGFTTSAGGTSAAPAAAAGRIGTTSPTEPDHCGVCGVWLERERDASWGVFPRGAAGPSPERAGAVTSRASKTFRQFWFGQRICTPRKDGSIWNRLWQWGQATMMCTVSPQGERTGGPAPGTRDGASAFLF